MGFITLAKQVTQIENVKISLKLLWPVVVVVFTVAVAWANFREENKDLKASIKQTDEKVDMMAGTLTDILKEQKVERACQAAVLKHIEQHLNIGLYIVRAPESMWDVATKLQVHPQVLSSMNPYVVDPTRLPVGTILEYPRRPGVVVSNENEIANPGPSPSVDDPSN
jgi:hypothetical protein